MDGFNEEGEMRALSLLALFLSMGGALGDDPGVFKHESKADFQKRMETLRADLDVRLAAFEKKAASLEKKARKAMDKKIRDLRRDEKILDKKLAKLKDKSGDKWEDLREGIDKAADHLKKAYEDIADSLKKEHP